MDVGPGPLGEEGRKPLYRADDPRRAHLMYDPRIRRGPACVATALAAKGGTSTGAAPGEGFGATAGGASGTLGRSQGSAFARTAGGGMTAATATAAIHNYSGRPPVATFEETGYLERNSRTRGITPFEARGALPPSKPIDLSAYLVEPPKPGPRGKGIEVEQSTQTDTMAPRPATPPFRPPKTGVDAATQIEHGTREAGDLEGWEDRLFAFDEAVGPLVDVLTEKTLEQAITELRRESDLNRLHVRKVAAQTYLAADAALEKQLTEVALGLAKTKQAALEAGRRRAAAQAQVMRKVAAYTMAKGLSRGPGKAAVWSRLHAWGFFLDPQVDAVRREVWPGLLEGVGATLEAAAAADAAAAAVVADALQAGTAQMRAVLEAEAAAAAEAARKYYIRVFVRVPRRRESIAAHEAAVKAAVEKCPHSAAAAAEAAATAAAEGGEAPPPSLCPSCAAALGSFDPSSKVVMVGPVPVQRQDIVAKVEANVFKWLLAQKEALSGGAPAAPPASSSSSSSSHPVPTLADIERVLTLARGKPLRLFLRSSKLTRSAPLLAHPLEELAELELRPAVVDAPAPAEGEGDGEEGGEGEGDGEE